MEMKEFGTRRVAINEAKHGGFAIYNQDGQFRENAVLFCGTMTKCLEFLENYFNQDS